MALTSSASSTKQTKKKGTFLVELRGSKADLERGIQLRRIAALASSIYVLPLFLFFSIADYFYYSNYFWEFLLYRMSTVVTIVVVNKFVQKSHVLNKIQISCTVFITGCAFPLHLMMYRLGDVGSPYYAGLILVVLGMTMGFRFTWPFYLTNISIITGPFLVLAFSARPISLAAMLSCMFLISVNLIASVSRFFHEELHSREFLGRGALQEELRARNDIIRTKTKEAVGLAELTKQFSPQVVQAIKSGTIDFGRVAHRTDICVIFIDIIGSTERFIRLDRTDLHKILTMFMEDSMDSLLQYEITIDKFMGDGVLGFSNDPVPQSDYIERVVNAALLINKKIDDRRREYEDLWLAPFQVGIGISAGFASVGFYGNERHMRSYTAIGRPVNLASRLGSSAKPEQILISNECVAKLESVSADLLNSIQFTEIGSLKLRGFENDHIRTYEISKTRKVNGQSKSGTSPICPFGHGELVIDIDTRGIFKYRCSHCTFNLTDLDQFKKAA